MQDKFDKLIKELEKSKIILEAIPCSDKISRELIIIGIHLMDCIQWSKEAKEKNSAG